MSGYAFALMIVSFGLVLAWYALNHERDRDGQDGVLGIRTLEEDDGIDRAPGHALRAVRDRKSAVAMAERREARKPQLRVREKAQEARTKQGGRPRGR